MTSKRILALVSLILVMCLSVFAFTACENNEKDDTKPGETVKPGEDNKDPVGDELKVSFMVQNDKGEWEVLKDVKVEDGKVVMPSAPMKKYYSFSGWFKDADAKDRFVETGIKASTKAYASYAPDEVNVTINGKAVGTQNLVDVVNKNYKPGEGLEFDGWYKDANCSVLWDGNEIVKDLYAKTVAKITISNGYEELYSTKVNPGEIFANPAETTITVDGTDTTLELSFIKSYMSKYDIDYVNENGELIDFTKPVEKSMNITVLWNTKDLTGFDELSKSKDGHYFVRVTQLSKELADAPVISIRNKYTVEKKNGEDITTETYTLDYIYWNAECLPETVKKLIFGDGIKVIQHLNGVGACSVEEIVLPKTLVILDDSFNNMPKLKGVTLPEGLEVLIDSFFINRFAQTAASHTLGETNPNFEIAVPDSVINLAMMPNNLTFTHTKATAENGDFYKGEDGRVYLKDERGLILVVDPAAVTGFYNISAAGMILPKAGTIIVPEGVVGIQVGTYITCFDYLILPTSFKFVNYNANMENYAEFYDIYHDFMTDSDGQTVIISRGGNVLFNESDFKQYFDPTNPEWQNNSNIEIEGVAITTNIGGFSYYGVINCGSGILVMPTAKDKRPEGIDFGFIKGGYYSSSLIHLDNFVSYVDDKNSVFITAPYEDPNTFFPGNVKLRLEDLKNISYAELKEALTAQNATLGALIKDCKEFNVYANGVKLEDGAAVTEDMYITVIVVEKAKLKVQANYQYSYIKNKDWTTDFSKPDAEGQMFASEKAVFALADITGLSADSLKKIIADMGADAAKDSFYGGMSSQEKPVFVDNIMYHLNNAVSVKYIANGEEITDLGSISLDNGSVTLEIVYVFA